MPVNPLKASSAAKPAPLTAAEKIARPFNQTSAALGNPRIKDALDGMQGQSPKELAKSIRTKLPELGKPLAEMIKLLDQPGQLIEATPSKAAANKLATSGWIFSGWIFTVSGAARITPRRV